MFNYFPLCAMLCVLALPSVLLAEELPSAPDETIDKEVTDAWNEVSEKDRMFFNPEDVGEVIEVWNERKEKPFERDTTLRLTGEVLAKQGVTQLAEALELLPDIYVRNAGRGGKQIDIRGARKGSVKVLIDGIAVSDPYYGNIDLTAIPITDIAQIRVSSAPASPIDGIGGPGGVIEIHTKDATGPRSVIGRLQASSFPSTDIATTAKTMLTDNLAARLSATAAYGGRDFTLLRPGETIQLDEKRRQSVGAMRLEYFLGKKRFAADLWMQHLSFVIPPTDSETADIQIVDGESQGRLGLQVDDHLGVWTLQAKSHLHRLERLSTNYSDATLSTPVRSELIRAWRRGGSILASRPLWNPKTHSISSINIDNESSNTFAFDGTVLEGGVTVFQAASGLQIKSKYTDVDVAVGFAQPVGIGAKGWPEYKTSLKTKKIPGFKVEFISGYKGRAPTLRERFRLDIGNSSLGPEKVLFNEFIVESRIIPRVGIRASAYQRNTNGMIRFDGNQNELINLGDLRIRGGDLQLELSLHDNLRCVLTASYASNQSELLGSQSLDFFPTWRANSQLIYQGERFGGMLRSSYVGDQIDRNETIPWRSTVDLSLYGRVDKDWLVNLRVENLGGEDYFVRNGVLGAPRIFFLSTQREWK